MSAVTIGICAKNAEKTIGLALKSALNQHYPHELMEIIVVDDGSDDTTLSIVNSAIAGADVHTKIFSSEWRGIGKARNTVVQNATGKYVVWLDSDETIASNFLERQVKLMDLHPEAGIGTARVGLPANENQVLTLDLIHSVVELYFQNWKNPSKLPGTGGTICRVKAIKQVGGFDQKISGAGEDVDVANRIRQKGWTIIAGDGLFFEYHGNTSNLTKMLRRYYYQGIHGRYLYQKSPVFYSLYRMNPFASFIGGARYSALGYVLTKRKIAFVFPFYYTLKKTAWFYGFSIGSRKKRAV